MSGGILLIFSRCAITCDYRKTVNKINFPRFFFCSLGMQIGEKHAQKSYHVEQTQTNAYIQCSGSSMQAYGHPRHSVAFSQCFNLCLDLFFYQIEVASSAVSTKSVKNIRNYMDAEFVWNELDGCQCTLLRLIRRYDAVIVYREKFE